MQYTIVMKQLSDCKLKVSLTAFDHKQIIKGFPTFNVSQGNNCTFNVSQGNN